MEPTDKLDNVEEQFWGLFGPWMKIPGSKFSRSLGRTIVEFPRDCIEVIRCRPFTQVLRPTKTHKLLTDSSFATKIVNRWFSKRTMLIGDAAHVFPPFGGQGIATGIRDAQGLGWRLAIMSRPGMSAEVRERILTGWSQERRHAWNAAMQATKLNGSIVNQRSLFSGLLYRICMRVFWWFPSIARYRTNAAFRDKLVYNHQTCPDGFFLGGRGGGQKIAQIWVRQAGQAPKLSDAAFIRNLSHLSLLVIVRDGQSIDPADVAQLIAAADLPEGLLTMEDVTFFRVSGKDRDVKPEIPVAKYAPCTSEELAGEGITAIKGYSPTAVEDRVDRSANLVLLRPDFFVHSVASDLEGMAENLQKVGEYFR